MAQVLLDDMKALVFRDKVNHTRRSSHQQSLRPERERDKETERQRDREENSHLHNLSLHKMHLVNWGWVSKKHKTGETDT